MNTNSIAGEFRDVALFLASTAAVIVAANWITTIIQPAIERAS